MKKIYSNELLSLQFCVLILLQPLIDIYRLFVGNAISVCGISLVEFINIALIGYLAVLFILNQRKLRSFVPALIYSAILMAYLALHCYNVLHFKTSVIAGTNISAMIEIYVIIRAYILPLMLLYMLIYTHTAKERFMHTVIVLAWIISTIIVVTNIFKVAYIAYASGFQGNRQIQQNIFDWFIQNAPSDVRLLTSKGWFYSGNQIGLILFMLLPFSVFQALTAKKVSSFVLVALQTVAMVMVSTKTAAFGSILIIVCIMVIFAGFAIYTKKLAVNWKPLLILLVIVVATVGLIQHAPVQKQVASQESSNQETNEEWEKADELLKKNNTEEKSTVNRNALIKQIETLYYHCGIQKEFIDMLPIKDNVQFWFSIIVDPSKPQVNFRSFKNTIFREVLRKNGNPNDKWLGIGYSTNFPYMERDVFSQNAWFGYIGTALLIGPYLIIILLSVIRMLKNFKKQFTFYNCTLLISALGSMGASMLAGYLFGFPFSALIFAYVVGHLFQSTRDIAQSELSAADNVSAGIL